MHAFIIGMSNQPGSLASALEALAGAGINLQSAAAATWGDSGAAAVLTDDSSAGSVLAAAGVAYSQAEVAVASLEHRPGTLAAAARALANAGINIEGVFPMGMDDGKVQVGFAVADAAAAQAALG